MPENAAFPRVLIQPLGGGIDFRSDNEQELIWSEPLILVKAIDRAARYDRISPVAARVYDLLNGTEGVIAGGRIVSCVRELSFPDAEQEGVTHYRIITQQFRLQVYANP